MTARLVCQPSRGCSGALLRKPETETAKRKSGSQEDEDWGLTFTFDITDACGCEKKTLKAEGRDETTSV
jgi:hypothetical protein